MLTEAKKQNAARGVHQQFIFLQAILLQDCNLPQNRCAACAKYTGLSGGYDGTTRLGEIKDK